MTRRRNGRQRSDCAAAARGVRLAGLLIPFLCAALAASLGVAAAAAAEPGEVVWRDFAQRAGGGVDVYTALAVGPTGTVCAAGSTASAPEAATDVLVRTYGSGGGVQWRRVWTWPGRSDDEARAVARDRRGAYVVAGASGANWLLLKYSRSGYLQWVRRARGRYARCSLIAVIVDGDGNVYATGRAAPGEGPESMLTLKYSSSGKLRWLKTFASEAGDSAAAGITLGGGAVYVAGTSQDGTGGSTAVLLKYATAGAQRWARACAGPGAEAARATALAYTSGPLLCGWSALPDGDEGFVALFSPPASRPGRRDTKPLE